MLRRLPRILVGLALLAFLVTGWQSILAADRHVGPGQQYATLEDLRLATPQGNNQLRDGDRIILHADDSSLRGELYFGYNVSITVMSNDPTMPRMITPAEGARTRLVYMDGSGYDYWSKVYFEGIKEIANFDPSDGLGGGVIYAWWNQYIYTIDAKGVTFRNNFSHSSYEGGGVVYYWDAIECDFSDSSFIDNKTTGPGGALYINASGTLVMTDHTDITIGASDGNISTFSGNLDGVVLNPSYVIDPVTQGYAYDDQGALIGYGTKNSIDFTGYTGKTANLFVKTEGTGILDMQDPFRVNYGDCQVNIIKTGTGTWKLGGISVTRNSGGTKIDIREGTLLLYQGAQLNAVGSNDEFTVASGTNVVISGNNTITGTRVLFSPGSSLSFDFNYYYAGGAPRNVPMLNLSGTTLNVQGVRIDIANVPFESVQPDTYVLIQGTSSLTVGEFDLWIGGVAVNEISKRFGYSLSYDVDPLRRQLALVVDQTSNSVLTWQNYERTGHWNFVDKNWDLAKGTEPTDSFIPGDAVIFNLSGDHTITLDKVMQFSSQDVESGMRVSGNGNWTFQGDSLSDLYNPVIPGSKKGTLVFDGSGSLRLINNGPNTYHGGTIISGGGTLYAQRGDNLGSGGIFFRNNRDNRLVFNTTSILDQTVTVEVGGKGTLTAAMGATLTVTVPTTMPFASVVEAGGLLTLQGDIRYIGNAGALIVNGGTVDAVETQFVNNGRDAMGDPMTLWGGAAYLSGGSGGKATFNGDSLQFTGNLVLEDGGAIYQLGSASAEMKDSAFATNRANDGGAWYIDGAAATATLSGGSFRANIADNDGGAVYVKAGNFTANDMRFEMNQAKQGGALAIVGGKVNLTDSQFHNNAASEYGGAIYYEAQTGSSLTLGATAGKTSEFSGNTAMMSSNSVSISGTGNQVAEINIVTEKGGVLDMLDPMSGRNDTYRAIITKKGEGTWRLADQSVFEGYSTVVTIEEGTLQLYKEDAAEAKIPAGQIDILMGTFAIEAGGTLLVQGGNRVSATNINFAQRATLAFDLSGYSENNTALLNLTASIWSANGWRQNIDLVALGNTENGVYNLMTVNGPAIDEKNMELLYRGEKMSELRAQSGKLRVNADGTTLQVEVDNAPTDNGTTLWTNATGDGIWNGTALNWEGKNNGSVDLEGTKQFLQGDAVVFTDLGAGNITVNAGGVEIQEQGLLGNAWYSPGMIVNNSRGNDYTFSGGSIVDAPGGIGALLKQGDGTLTFLQQENGFSGGTAIEGGTVVAVSVKSLGTGDVNTGNATSNGTIQFDLDADNSGEFAQKIDGGGSLVKSGVGNLTLSNAANAYSGGTTILGGKLIVDDANAIGTGRIDTGLSSANGTMVFDLQNQDGVVNQTISGAGAVVKSGEKSLTLNGANSYSGGTTIEAGRLTAKNINAIGTGNILNNGELEFDFGNGTTESFDQRIDGSGSVIKTGDNSLILTAANTYSGTTTFDAGKLSIANAAALQNSTLNILGGTFGFEALTKVKFGGLSGTGDLTLTNDAALAVALTVGNNGLNAEYSGNLDGKGSLAKIGSGTQTLSGMNAYSGGTIVEEGRLVAVGLDALGTGSIKTNAELELFINTNDFETLDRVISGTGSVEKSGKGTLEITTYQTYTGGTLVSEGMLKIGSFDLLETGDINVHSGELLVDVAQDTVLASNFSVGGNGILTKTGNGILTVNDNVALAGTLNINGGGLFVNATTKALTTMEAGTTLGGNGHIDNTVILKSGATQVVGGQGAVVQSAFAARDFVYEGDSTIYVKVGKYGSDRIIADNGFNFARGGGTVNVIFLSLDDFGNEEITMQYNVFTAAGGLLTLDGALIDNHSSVSSTLQIDGVLADIQFLSGDGELDVIGYDVRSDEKGRSINVDLLTTGGPSYPYLTDNQRTVLLGVGSTSIYDRFFKTTKEYRGAVLNELTPMIQTAMPYLSERGVTQYNLAAFERLRFLRQPLGLDAEREPDYRGSSYRLMHRHGKQNYLWFQNFGDFLRTQSDAHCSGIHADGYGFSVGVDRGIDAHSVVGIGLGGYFVKARTTDVSQNAEANSFLLSAYGQRRFQEDWTLSGAGGLAFNRYEIDRYAPSFGTTLSSEHNGTAVYTAVELTRKFLLNNLEVSPYLDVNWIWLSEAGAVERAVGDPTLALRIDGQNTYSFLSTVGLRLGHSFRLLEKNIVNPSFYFGWVQDWGNGRIRTTAAFPGEPTFTIRGASMRNNRAVVGVNLNMTMNNRMDFFARFNSELAENYSDLSMHWGIRLGF